MLKSAVAALLVVALTAPGFAQKKPKAPTERTVSGAVTDPNGNPAPGAIVQLKNLKTLQVRSFIARDMGEYTFTGLALDTDYELKAESNGKSSATRTLSSLDGRTDVKINLQLKE